MRRRPSSSTPPPPLAQLQRTLMRALYAPRSRSNRAPRDGLALYRRMGALRFEREVAREFPRVRALLGDEEFAALARAFVASHRSRSFTLEGYADTLPRFIARTRGRSAAHALASFELALRRAQRADSKPATPRPGALAHAPGARVTSGPRRASVAVFQRDGRAAWLDVAAAEAPLLRSLLRGARVDRAVARTRLSPARIRAAFERWVAAGLLLAAPSPE
ncbi:MAG TPA: DNA-binding domain-containing protein [Myxococcota bacterium]|nr:DNA-binding domain-containing protein [Myxococcota bacterium]